VAHLGFAKAKLRLVSAKGAFECLALADTGAWYTVVDEDLAEQLGVEYTGLTLSLTSFSGHRIACREAVLKSITVEDRTAPLELIATCRIPSPVKDLLRGQGVDERVIIGVHTLERLGYAVDVVTHKLIQSPGVLMLDLLGALH